MNSTTELPDWAPLVRGLRTRFHTGDFTVGLALVNAFARAAQAANHHPDITLSYGDVDVLLFSHDVGDVTDRDRALAAQFSAIAREQSVPATPELLSVVEVGLDTADAPQIAPFWAAVLGAEAREVDGEIDICTHTADAILWFQSSEPHETPRQRFHFDVWVDPRHAQARIDAALAAGGRLVSDEHAPAFWVLADAQGNNACICTTESRTD